MPAMTRVIKLAAPTSSPTASSGLLEEIAAHVEKMSGPEFIVSFYRSHVSNDGLLAAVSKGE